MLHLTMWCLNLPHKTVSFLEVLERRSEVCQAPVRTSVCLAMQKELGNAEKGGGLAWVNLDHSDDCHHFLHCRGAAPAFEGPGRYV